MEKRKGLIVFIVDDELTARETLANDLKRFEAVGEVHTFTSYAEATLPLLDLQPDILFLDVEVPGRTGLEFLDAIRPRLNFTFKTVFYTAFSHYMLDAIRRAAYDFLLKPYKEEELQTVMNRIISDCQEKPRQFNPISDEMPRKLALQSVTELLLLRMEQILIFVYNADTRSWQLTLTDQTVHLLKKGVNAENLLALHPALTRISNTCIININYLAAIENSTQRCRLCPPFDKLELTVSRRYFSKLKEQFELL